MWNQWWSIQNRIQNLWDVEIVDNEMITNGKIWKDMNSEIEKWRNKKIKIGKLFK